MSVQSNADSIRVGQSVATDAATAVEEFSRSVRQDDTALVVFFCSSRYDLDVIAAEMNQRFCGVPVVGCTTAGEIGPAGYLDGSLAGFSLSRAGFAVADGLLDDLGRFEISRGQALAQTLLQQLESDAHTARADNSFAILLVDGLSIREEPVARAVQSGLGEITMFGGSAGDDLKFERTRVFSQGRFHDNAALLILIHTSLPFHIFKTQHFVCDAERLVVTEADPVHRVVREINGLPAAEEYARAVGIDAAHLNPNHFATAPVVVVIDGTDYVRAIQKLNPDGSLTFFSAIEEGLVLRVAHGVDLLESLNQTLDGVVSKVGDAQLTIACDCILRNLEVTGLGQKAVLGELFKRHRAVGFSTYGEQIQGVHVNQTLTGVVIGR